MPSMVFMMTDSVLTPEQEAILDQGGTEPPGSSRWLNHRAAGRYVCVRCRQPLFDSQAKFDSGSGWPSFWQPVESAAVSRQPDDSAGLRRTEVRCGGCDGHLGHVFTDAPQTPTGQRYCLNGAVLDFRPASSITAS